MPVVILGGGIIGLSTAYYLSLFSPATDIHIVEPSPTLFASASGKAAGFLAKDWFSPAVAPLGAFSFDLHRQLAEEHRGTERWGYSESISYSLDRDSSGNGDGESWVSEDSAANAMGSERSGAGTPRRNHADASPDLDWLMTNSSRALATPDTNVDAHAELPTWLRARASALAVISDRGSTAQVDPRRLCEFLFEECKARRVVFHHPASATKLVRTDPANPHSPIAIRIQHAEQGETSTGTTIGVPVENLVIAAGCWTPKVYKTLFPNAGRMPRVGALPGYSITVKSPRWDPKPEVARSAATAPLSHAIFTSDPSGFSPEIFSRLSGDIWIGGLNPRDVPLPTLPIESVPLPPSSARTPSTSASGTSSRLPPTATTALETLASLARKLCGPDARITSANLCFRPVSPTGRPVIARMHAADLGDGEGVEIGRRGGVYVAAGHGPWGISMSLGTGWVIAEMVLGREPRVDVRGLGWEAAL